MVVALVILPQRLRRFVPGQRRCGLSPYRRRGAGELPDPRHARRPEVHGCGRLDHRHQLALSGLPLDNARPACEEPVVRLRLPREMVLRLRRLHVCVGERGAEDGLPRTDALYRPGLLSQARQLPWRDRDGYFAGPRPRGAGQIGRRGVEHAAAIKGEGQTTMRIIHRRNGFTLLELLVVIVIIGLLAGYVAPRYFSQVGKSEIQVARAQNESLDKGPDPVPPQRGPPPPPGEGPGAARPEPFGGAGLERSVPQEGGAGGSVG